MPLIVDQLVGLQELNSEGITVTEVLLSRARAAELLHWSHSGGAGEPQPVPVEGGQIGEVDRIKVCVEPLATLRLHIENNAQSVRLAYEQLAEFAKEIKA